MTVCKCSISTLETYIAIIQDQIECGSMLSKKSLLNIISKIRKFVDIELAQIKDDKLDFFCLIDTYLENLSLCIESDIRVLDESIFSYHLDNIQYVISLYQYKQA